MKLIALISGLFMSISANAALWSETSVTYLRGNNNAEIFGADNNRTELTFESASGFKYGDNFVWFEVTDPYADKEDATDTEIYGEWSPRFSIGKTFGFYNKDRIVQDVLVASTFEYGRSGVPTRTKLIGLGLDLKIPYFAFFQYNLYVRDNLDKDSTTLQSTIAYRVPINVTEKVKIQYGAYIDIVHGDEGTDAEGKVESHWHTGQQVFLDLGNFWGSANLLYVGFEYQYWSQKFGGKGNPNENNLKWAAKWVF